MRKYTLFILLVAIALIIAYIFYPKTVKRTIIDNKTLNNVDESVKIIAPITSKESLALNALNKLYDSSEKGFSEIPKELKFTKVEYDKKDSVATVYARFDGTKESLSSFQESKMLLQIFNTVKLNIPEAKKFRIIFSGDSPFTELRTDLLFTIEDENLIVLGE
ncbi:GerMN domain-containing protein [Calditerrivibrio nitroreducens]|uniref:GerMN domain-containing protein n=1 Tax=Calditerrivibrio nitroreducens (strain DSM 19672 / NBRC 101217 / Yu37-1) TaxID=768670 RepID=E4TFM8_CALNY|nr:GerMN domain-containing protein [Calditerrivibrio nitroreducens]ADR18496.1 hypothetical protein Calni_0584 [Calditerrivibrio nitroreducens DSM 19672]